MKKLIIVAACAAVIVTGSGCATCTTLGLVGCLTAVAAGTTAAVNVITLSKDAGTDTQTEEDGE